MTPPVVSSTFSALRIGHSPAKMRKRSPIVRWPPLTFVARVVDDGARVRERRELVARLKVFGHVLIEKLEYERQAVCEDELLAEILELIDVREAKMLEHVDEERSRNLDDNFFVPIDVDGEPHGLLEHVVLASIHIEIERGVEHLTCIRLSRKHVGEDGCRVAFGLKTRARGVFKVVARKPLALESRRVEF